MDLLRYRVDIFWAPRHSVLAGIRFDSDRQWQIQILDEQIEQTRLVNDQWLWAAVQRYILPIELHVKPE